VYSLLLFFLYHFLLLESPFALGVEKDRAPQDIKEALRKKETDKASKKNDVHQLY